MQVNTLPVAIGLTAVGAGAGIATDVAIAAHPGNSLEDAQFAPYVPAWGTGMLGVTAALSASHAPTPLRTPLAVAGLLLISATAGLMAAPVVGAVHHGVTR